MTFPYHTPLKAAEQVEFGVEAPAPFAMADRVRFSELDVLNHVNNAVYLQWFESVRVRYTKHYGISRNLGGAEGPRIVIRSGAIHYRQEMLLDEDYVVTCGCSGFRNTSFSMHQELWSGGTLRATFDCVLVLLKKDGTGRFQIPDPLRQKFIEIDKAEFDT